MTWTFEPLTAGLMVVSAGIYALGLRAAWQQGGAGTGFRPWHVAAFYSGMVALAVALMSPLAWLSDLLFSAHMTQHEVLMLVAAPLLVFGQPLLAMLWAVPPGRRTGLIRAVRRRSVMSAWLWLTTPLVVFLLHGLALWIWHIPALFEWALHNEAVHAVQHLSFVGTAALFWWGMVHGRYGRAAYGSACSTSSSRRYTTLSSAPCLQWRPRRGIGRTRRRLRNGMSMRSRINSLPASSCGFRRA